MSVSTYVPRCPKPDPLANGLCRNCGRPTAVVNAMLQHKRGRWRDPLPEGNPLKVRRFNVQRSTVVAIPAAHVPTCSDCDAYMQRVAAGWRCPWATSSHSGDDGTFEGVAAVRCDWPFKNPEGRRVA